MTAQRWAVGAKLEVPLSDGTVVPAMMLQFPEIAFFHPSDPSQVLFRVWVHKSAWAQGRWRKTAKASLPADLQGEVPRFKQDPLSGSLSIYLEGKERAATMFDCEGLERAAVWDPSHVEERLRDHLAGKPNKWVQSLSST